MDCTRLAMYHLDHLYLRWWFPLQVSFRCSVNNNMLHNFLGDNVTSGRPGRNAVNERENRN